MAWFRAPGNPGGSLKVRTASGQIAAFETNMADVLQSVKCEINARGGNGTPDNPNPIVGYTEANIVNTQNESIADLFSIDSDFRGNVAFNQNIATTSGNQSTISVLSDGVYKATSNGNAPYFGFGLRDGSNAIFKPIVGHKYYLRFNLVDVSISDANVLSSGNGINSTYTTTVGIKEKVIQASANVATYINFSTNGTSLATDYFTIKDINIIDLTAMFGSTIADYIYGLEQNNAGAGVAFFRNIYPEDYYAYDSGTTEIVGKETPEATIAFGQTVYGGVLDVTRGKLRVDCAKATFDLSQYTPTTANRYDSYLLTLTDLATDSSGSSAKKLCNVCERYSWSGSTVGYEHFYIGGANAVIYLDENTYRSKTVEFSYPLATPFDIDLTPVQVEQLLGKNNVWHDANGDTEVKYLEVVRN